MRAKWEGTKTPFADLRYRHVTRAKGEEKGRTIDENDDGSLLFSVGIAIAWR